MKPSIFWSAKPSTKNAASSILDLMFLKIQKMPNDLTVLCIPSYEWIWAELLSTYNPEKIFRMTAISDISDTTKGPPPHTAHIEVDSKKIPLPLIEAFIQSLKYSFDIVIIEDFDTWSEDTEEDLHAIFRFPSKLKIGGILFIDFKNLKTQSADELEDLVDSVAHKEGVQLDVIHRVQVLHNDNGDETKQPTFVSFVFKRLS